MNGKFIALLLLGMIVSGLIYTHPAYAHNFGGDESAGWLAKVNEIKTEVNNVAKHVGQKKVIDYYNDALGEYWNSNDTKEMGEKNALLQKEIPVTINATITDANAGNQNMVNDDVSKLSGYLDESVPVRVDKDKLNNSTVQALAVTFVLKEALEKYGNALNSTADLNDMSQMNTAGGNMSSMSMSASTIVNDNAYENSVSLATTAQQMFSTVATNNPSVSDNAKISAALSKLVKDLNSKADVNTIMIDTHEGIHPTLITAYKIQEANSTQSAVPEFPLPAILAVISIAGVVVATRFKSHIGF
jgi:phosphopantetheinyl transferase (holo-ACP synthase)